MLGLVTVVGSLLVVAWALRIASWAGGISLGSMPDFARAITVALGAWEIGCLAGVVVPLVRRRRYRVQYRMPTVLRARIDRTSTIVPVLDLTPDGIAFESPVALSTRIVLLTRLPDTQGRVHDFTLPVDIRWCTPNETGTGFRVGGRFESLSGAEHELLVEYCFVVQPARQLGAELDTGRPETGVPEVGTGSPEFGAGDRAKRVS
jgi:hypothetical protein